MPSMPLHFHQAVQTMDIWSASSADISFVISFSSPNGAGFRGRHGFLASWRPLYSGKGAIKVTGSPFSTFEEAEAACNAMLKVLSEVRKPGDRPQAKKADRIASGIRIQAADAHLGPRKVWPDAGTPVTAAPASEPRQ